MEYLLIALFVIVVGAIVYYLLDHDARDRAITYINEERTREKERRKKLIMERMKQDRKMTNDDVQALFDVSHATATRYFDELQEEGKIIEQGEGRGTYYERA